MRKIRIGQIGIGHFHASGKMDAARKFPDIFDVVGIAETDPDNMKKFSGRKVYQGLKWMSPEELLSVSGLDAVLVETNEWDLVPVAQQCIDAGVHIHMDKPGGEDIDAYKRMLKDAERKKLTVQLGYMYRYNPAVQYCCNAIKSGMLGEIFELDTVMGTEHVKAVREYLNFFKGGIMYFLGCHLVDLVISMLGKPENIIPYSKKTFLDGVSSYDNGFAVFEYPRCIATVRSNSTEINGHLRRQVVLCGSKGTIEIKPLEDPTVMSVFMADHSRMPPPEYAYPPVTESRIVGLPGITGRYDAQILDFAAMIRGEKANPFTYEHELLVQKATLKASGFDIDID